MKHLIVIDSDGTLRHSNGTISDRAKLATNCILNKGHYIVLCTARPRYHAQKIGQELGSYEYLISSNGSEIYDNMSKKVIFAAYLSGIDCEKIYNYARKNNIRIMFVLDDKEYVTKFVRNGKQILLDDSNIFDVLNSDVKQAMIIGKEKEKIKKFKNIVVNEFYMNVVDSSDNLKDEFWFSVVSRDASKGIALIKLAEYLNIPMTNTIAIGNDNNDISMLKVAAKSVAVDNATNDAKVVAKEIVNNNDEDGVAIYLEKFLEGLEE